MLFWLPKTELIRYSFLIGSNHLEWFTFSGPIHMGSQMIVFVCISKTLRRSQSRLPPPDEQVRIGKFFSLWDKAITQTEKLIEAKQKLKTGLMQQLLTGKRRFPGFKDKWQMMSVKDLCTYIGSGGTPSTSVARVLVWDHSVDNRGGLYRARDWSCPTLALRLKLSKVARQEFAQGKHSSRKSYWGRRKLALVPFDGIAISQDITVLELTPDFTHPAYSILLCSQPCIVTLQRFNQGTSINGVTSDRTLFVTRSLCLLCTEQRKIATVLRVMDSEIDSLTSCVEQLKEQKRGLMQKLLTGQIRVKAAEEVTAS